MQCKRTNGKENHLQKENNKAKMKKYPNDFNAKYSSGIMLKKLRNILQIKVKEFPLQKYSPTAMSIVNILKS